MWKFQRFEFSWRAGFFGCYVTEDQKKMWICIVPFYPMYYKRV